MYNRCVESERRRATKDQESFYEDAALWPGGDRTTTMEPGPVSRARAKQRNEVTIRSKTEEGDNSPEDLVPL